MLFYWSFHAKLHGIFEFIISLPLQGKVLTISSPTSKCVPLVWRTGMEVRLFCSEELAAEAEAEGDGEDEEESRSGGVAMFEEERRTFRFSRFFAGESRVGE